MYMPRPPTPLDNIISHPEAKKNPLQPGANRIYVGDTNEDHASFMLGHTFLARKTACRERIVGQSIQRRAIALRLLYPTAHASP